MVAGNMLAVNVLMIFERKIMRKPTMQIEQMEQANVRPGYNARRPAEMLEMEERDERKRIAPRRLKIRSSR